MHRDSAAGPTPCVSLGQLGMLCSRRVCGKPVGLILLFLMCSGLTYVCFMPRLTVREIEQRIQAELPLGSPKEVVEAWLKAQPHVKFSRSDAAIFQNTGPRLSLGAPTHIRVIFK